MISPILPNQDNPNISRWWKLKCLHKLVVKFYANIYIITTGGETAGQVHVQGYTSWGGGAHLQGKLSSHDYSYAYINLL